MLFRELFSLTDNRFRFGFNRVLSFRLGNSLKEFIQFKSNCDELGVMDILNELPTLPKSLKVKHAAKTWCYIWTRYTTQLQ